MRVQIISVGKPSDKAILSLSNEYEKRLQRWTDIEWRILPNGKSVQDEGVAILRTLKTDDFVVLMDERGQQYTTEVMAHKLDSWLSNSRRLVFVIGGAYGVDDIVQSRADYIWSFSDLVFPHQLMRVMLLEQLYRMFSVLSGGKYHHS
ncbi:23S rRNA (pseudouridine(1915)-N(3))-methyltransferase RlmH [Candidatus Saccharibacteria bacterium]|nr:23S rRNA (pseudouridine(1915)-N(3))-methyltransferase RlmH [Candidatus Saccharibacteria bacterium]